MRLPTGESFINQGELIVGGRQGDYRHDKDCRYTGVSLRKIRDQQPKIADDGDYGE